MAYNLQSLITILQKILNPDEKRWDFDHVKPQLESLMEKAASLQRILENSSPKMERFGSQIQDAAHEAEDIIESHMVNQMVAMPGIASFTIYPPDLQQVIQQLHNIVENVMKIMDGSQISTSSSSAAAAADDDDDTSNKNTLVGLDQDLMQLKDRLSGLERKLQIIPIVGMGGIGKTTLARSLYDDQTIVAHFDICAWITVSQDYNVRAILLGLLGCMNKELIAYDLPKTEDNELKDILYKKLYGRRYLIVFDDMWSADVWNDVKRCFPNNDNHSRIMLTTRESNVGKYVDSESLQHEMHLLNKSESWHLLHRKVFGKDNCPAELERMGRSIASNCGGLPLAIHVIGGLLSEAKRSEDVWEKIANDVRAAIAERDKQFSSILLLSYNHLPNHLRPCFLYMGAFPEDYEIRASRLIRLWVAEGFLKSSGDISFEEEAEDCLKALVERNLVLVRKNKSNGKPKSLGMHDLLRDLCIRKGDQEKFLHLKINPIVPKGPFYSPRRLNADSFSRFICFKDDVLTFSLTRSFVCQKHASFFLLANDVFHVSRLVRVLDIFSLQFSDFPTEILQLVNLRYLALCCYSAVPYEISRLWNLQTLIVTSSLDTTVDIPSEIWEMPELRCLKFKNTLIRYSGSGAGFLGKLHAISTILLHGLLEMNFFVNFPSIRSLKLDSRGLLFPAVIDLHRLHKLETLGCSSLLQSATRGFLSCLRLPPSLKKLTLKGCAIPQEFMTTLCELPHLQVLKIRQCVFKSQEKNEANVKEWEARGEEEYSSLQHLLLSRLNLVRWQASEANFPRLQRLVIRRCSDLEEIPRSIGEIPTLQLIDLDDSSPSAVASAKQIQEEQQSEYENYDLQLRIVEASWMHDFLPDNWFEH